MIRRMDDHDLAVASINPIVHVNRLPVVGVDAEAIRPQKVLAWLETRLISANRKVSMFGQIQHVSPNLVCAAQQVGVSLVNARLDRSHRARNGDVAPVRNQDSAFSGKAYELALERA